MNLRKTLLAATSVSLFSFGGFAQTEEKPEPQQKPQAPQVSPCPQMQIQSGARTVREGQPVTFTARISGGDKNVTPSILWNLSSGVIQDGQGTQRVVVDSTGAGMNREMVAELWVMGYAPECQMQSEPFRVTVVPPAAKLDEFGELPADQETEKIAAAVKFAQYGNDRLYVIGYAGRNSERNYANTALRRFRDQIMKAGLPPARVGAYDGGFREQPAFELWLVPDGAEPPRPTPTIDRKEIVYPTTPRTTRTRTPARRP